MTAELPHRQHNNLISLISQVLISPYLIYSVHPPPTFCRGVCPPTESSERGDLRESQFSERVAGKESVTFFGGGSFYIKNRNT